MLAGAPRNQVGLGRRLAGEFVRVRVASRSSDMRVLPWLWLLWGCAYTNKAAPFVSYRYTNAFMLRNSSRWVGFLGVIGQVSVGQPILEPGSFDSGPDRRHDLALGAEPDPGFAAGAAGC